MRTPSRFRHLLLLAAVFIGLGALTSCGPKEKVVKIAIAVPLTGDMGTEGQGLRRAIELAVEQVNAAKRFPFRIEGVPFDDRADPKEAVNVANLIVSDSRIVAVIDAWDAMTSDRPYRKALGRDIAVAELRKGAGTQFDPKIVDAFLAVELAEAEASAHH